MMMNVPAAASTSFATRTLLVDVDGQWSAPDAASVLVFEEE